MASKCGWVVSYERIDFLDAHGIRDINEKISLRAYDFNGWSITF